MSGLFHLSQQQIVDNFGKPIVGAKASFFRADTLTPISVYRDSSLSSSWGTVVTSDGSGRWPTVFLDDSVDSFYRFRVTTSGGVIIIDLDTLPIIGPGGGGGGGGTVDPNALIRTGDVIWGTTTGARTGFVRGNGRTIGSAGSGATERANADTQALFEHLWNNYPNTTCPVSGGRGANSAADWAANKTIGTLDLRGTILGGVDTMGASGPANRITSATVTNPDTIGSSGGAQTVAIAQANLPNVALSVSASGTTGTESVLHNHGFSGTTSNPSGQVISGQTTTQVPSTPNEQTVVETTIASTHTHTFSGTTATQNVSHTHGVTVSGSTSALGSGAALVNMPPTMLGTWFVKL